MINACVTLLKFLSIFVIAAILLYFQPNKEKLASASRKTFTKRSNSAYIQSTNDLLELRLNLKINQKDSIMPGYILLPTGGNEKVLLIDSEANILHSWPYDVERARLSSNCNLLVVFGSKWGSKKEPWSSLKNTISEFSWDANLLWEYVAPDIIHHDFKSTGNENILLIHRAIVSQNLRLEQYQDPLRWSGIRSDTILEINKDKDTVWQWNAHEHLDINHCGQRHCLFHVQTQNKRKRLLLQDWTHMNSVSVIPDNHWYAQGHEEFKPGNLIIMPRNFWEVMIISKDNKNVVWKYAGKPPNDLIYGHDAQMIPEGFPGAGNILVFNNGGGEREYSIIQEINPLTKKIVWSYSDPGSFFIPSGGAMQRLKNGNTFISGDKRGQILEVDASGKVVWKMKSNLRVNRAYKYPVNYCEEFSSFGS